MSSPKTVRILRIASGAILLLWVLLLLGGEAAAQQIAKVAGSFLARIGQGKFADPNLFVYMRMREALVLLTAGCVLGTLGWFGSQMLRSTNAIYRWALGALVWFVALNLLLVVAMRIALFWALFWHGDSTSNYAQHQFKQMLLPENPRPRAILLGSSQTRAQIDETILNRELAGQLWTTELHFPGSRPCDLWLMVRRVDPQPGDLLICYLSEGYFYTGVNSECLPYFLKLTDLPGLTRFGGPLWWKEQNLYYGILGNCLPLFRVRDAAAQRFLGARMVNIKQLEHDESLSIDLRERAKSVARDFRRGETLTAQKAAFHGFIQECKKRRVKLVLCAGQLNPLVYEHLAPAYREDYLNFLREIQTANLQVTVLFPERLGWQPPETYLDLTHVNKEQQTAFSLQLSAWLRQNYNEIQTLQP